MRGRLPKPAEVRDAQGNPGRRPSAAALPPDQGDVTLPFVQLSEDAHRAYDIIGAALKRLNFVRSSDESLLLRYADAVARYWRVTAELDGLGSESYECQMTGGGVMQRLRPQFMVQQLLAKRLEAMEDRLGLSPMARQQYMLRMSQTGLQPSLPLADAASEPPAQRPGSAVGLLNRNALN